MTITKSTGTAALQPVLSNKDLLAQELQIQFAYPFVEMQELLVLKHAMMAT